MTLLVPDDEDKRIDSKFSCQCSTCNEDCPCVNRFACPGQGFEVPLFECNSNCICLNCFHKNVKLALVPKVLIEKTQLKGLGVFAGQEIKKGQFIGEYAGVVVDDELAQGEFVFQIRENTPSRVIVSTIDAGFFGNFTRFFNHSCEPNIQPVPVRVDYIIPNLAFFALRDIKPGEELTFSYREQDIQKLCLCGSRKCKGFY